MILGNVMKKPFQFKRVKARLLFWFSIVAALPMLIAGITIYFQQIKSIKAEAYNKLTAIRDLKVMQVENWLEERTDNMRILAKDLIFVSLEQIMAKKIHNKADSMVINEVEELFKDLVENYGEYQEVFVIDARNGSIFISSDVHFTGYDKSGDPYFTEPLKTGKLFIRNIYFSKTTNSLDMTYSFPIFKHDDDKVIFAVVVVRINLEESLYALLRDRTGMGDTGETFIVDENAVALSDLRWYQNAPLRLKISSKPAVFAAFGKEGIIETKDYRGVQVLAA